MNSIDGVALSYLIGTLIVTFFAFIVYKGSKKH
jgi:hypothetical protein